MMRIVDDAKTQPTTYTYDNANRVTRILHQGSSGVIEDLHYTYDAAGNRTSLSRANGTASLLPAAVASATYDAANEQTQFGTATLTYDANGNLTNDGTNTYTWDARNRLVSISGGVTAGFQYDALGRRLSKTINGVTTQYQHSGLDIISEIENGAIVATYIRDPGHIDEPFIRQETSSKEYYPQGALWSTLALTDDAGVAATTYQYDDYGASTTSGVQTSNPFQYVGRENDGNGLYYFRARYYSSQFRRFLTEDPIGFSGGDWNLYRYALGNPVNQLDPLGLRVEVIVWEPVGWGQSSFGHVNTIINGTSYSFHPGGMDVLPASDYIATNTSFRTGIGPILKMTADQEQTFEDCLRQPQGSYSALTNNCTGPVRRCLTLVGFKLRNSPFPVDLGNDLLDSGRVSAIAEYGGSQRDGYSLRHSPWAQK